MEQPELDAILGESGGGVGAKALALVTRLALVLLDPLSVRAPLGLVGHLVGTLLSGCPVGCTASGHVPAPLSIDVHL